MLKRSLCLLGSWLLIGACGGGGSSTPDATLCGNGVEDPGEQCDDGNLRDDDACTSACKIACGDGIVGPAEQCDLGIPAGQPGACPMERAECDDGVVCTRDTLAGADCTLRCENTVIEDFVDGDGCCPDVTDAAAFWDLDCASACGNGLLEMGETCDTAIPTGEPGACPTDCNDGEACTVDTLTVPADNMPGDGACRARCEYAVNTAVTDDDGCCPPGATDATDNDCTSSASCGNGVRNSGIGETCDTAIAEGMPGACPTSCTAPDSCTSTLLLSAGTCQAKCWEVPVSHPANDDMCCPVFYGANNRNDNDCTTSCGTPAEECDTPGVGSCDPDCRIVRHGYRITSLRVVDPHIYWNIGDGNCPDLTPVVNNTVLPNAIKQDQDGDGYAQIGLSVVFKPLDQAGAATPVDLVSAKCEPSADPAQTTCIGDPVVPRIVSNANNMVTGMCLDIVPNTLTAAYGGPPAIPMAPCFVSDKWAATVALGSLSVPLTDGFFAATYDADPADNLVDGLLRGFLSEADAMASIIPDSVALVGGKSLYEVLAGGIAPGSCNVTMGTPIGDDRDTGPDGMTRGWYFYVQFQATLVPFDDRPNASE